MPIVKSISGPNRPLLIAERENDDERDDARVYGPPEIEIVRASTTPIDDDDNDINDDGNVISTPATSFVLILGHHEVPERQRGKFSPHHGGPDDPHLAQRKHDLERIERDSEESVYPAIKDANDTPLLMGEEPGRDVGSGGKSVLSGQDVTLPVKRYKLFAEWVDVIHHDKGGRKTTIKRGGVGTIVESKFEFHDYFSSLTTNLQKTF